MNGLKGATSTIPSRKKITLVKATDQIVLFHRPPTPRCPAPEKLNIANEANPIPAKTISAISAFVDIRRINKAYIIFPIYSKNKDQLGPFKGKHLTISTDLRPGTGYSRYQKRLISKASITMDIETCVPSHFSHPFVYKTQ